MALLFYNIFLSFYAVGIRIAAFTNNKAKAWLEGRKNLFHDLMIWRARYDAEAKIVWMHCASLGEFEQGRPVIERIKTAHPDHIILITFFSPSGYLVRKNYTGADGVFYLPPDGHRSAQNFIEIVRPSLVIWIKYEYWYYYLTLLKQKQIPVILISAIFRKEQPFFKPYGGIWKKMAGSFRQIFVQDEASLSLLRNYSVNDNAIVAGDTRFDRVLELAKLSDSLPEKLNYFCKGNKVLVAGSTWPEDEEILAGYAKMHSHIKFIVAPHEISKEKLKATQTLFANAVFYSDFLKEDNMAQVLIIDNIGLLSKLYALADAAYIGGGFNKSGIHNILEAAVFGKPVVFGGEYQKFQEAKDLVAFGGAFSVKTAAELCETFDKLFNDEHFSGRTGEICKQYVLEKKGATDIIIEYLQANRLLTI